MNNLVNGFRSIIPKVDQDLATFVARCDALRNSVFSGSKLSSSDQQLIETAKEKLNDYIRLIDEIEQRNSSNY